MGNSTKLLLSRFWPPPCRRYFVDFQVYIFISLCSLRRESGGIICPRLFVWKQLKSNCFIFFCNQDRLFPSFPLALFLSTSWIYVTFKNVRCPLGDFSMFSFSIFRYRHFGCFSFCKTRKFELFFLSQLIFRQLLFSLSAKYMKMISKVFWKYTNKK